MFKLNLLLLLMLNFFLSGCGGGQGTNNESTTIQDNFTQPVKAFFGDKEQNQVVVVDITKMRLEAEIPTEHQITYTADKVYKKNKVYVVNRGSNAIDVVTVDPVEFYTTINLEHFPRSAEAMNKKENLCEVSGMDKPMASIIDTNDDHVISSVGLNEKVDPNNNPNFGGSHATGHPFWLDKHHFVLLDRYHRKIVTYYIEKNTNNQWITKKLNELNTTTSIHQIIPSKGNYLGEPGYFFATAEGAKDIYPSILKLKLEPKKGLTLISELTLKKEGVNVNDMWLHHGDFHPSQKLIYVGSGDGTLFIVNYETMQIEKTLPVGKGAGHTVMIPKKDLAIVINHKDIFISVIHLPNNKKITDVKVSEMDHLVGKSIIQAHPKYYVSKDGKYFYAFLTAEGKIYELDLYSLKINRVLETGGQPAQGSFVEIK